MVGAEPNEPSSGRRSRADPRRSRSLMTIRDRPFFHCARCRMDTMDAFRGERVLRRGGTPPAVRGCARRTRVRLVGAPRGLSARGVSRPRPVPPARAPAARRLAARRRGRVEQKSTAPLSWLRRRGARDAGGGARPREDGGVPEGSKRAEVRARRPARRARRPEPRTALGDPCTPFGAPFSRTPSALLTGDDPPLPSPPRPPPSQRHVRGPDAEDRNPIVGVHAECVLDPRAGPARAFPPLARASTAAPREANLTNVSRAAFGSPRSARNLARTRFET